MFRSIRDPELAGKGDRTLYDNNHKNVRGVACTPGPPHRIDVEGGR